MVKPSNKNIVNKEIISTISSKGQITLPVEIREFLGVDKNEKVAFVVNDAGNIYLKTPKYDSIASLANSAKPVEEHLRNLTWDQIREIAIEDHIKENYIK